MLIKCMHQNSPHLVIKMRAILIWNRTEISCHLVPFSFLKRPCSGIPEHISDIHPRIAYNECLEISRIQPRMNHRWLRKGCKFALRRCYCVPWIEQIKRKYRCNPVVGWSINPCLYIGFFQAWSQTFFACLHTFVACINASLELLNGWINNGSHLNCLLEFYSNLFYSEQSDYIYANQMAGRVNE